MRRLRQHFDQIRDTHPDDPLLIVFDLDGTVLDEGNEGNCESQLRVRPGVLEVIRWFQLQPSTSVGFATRRPEHRRDDTHRTLLRLGRELRVEFDVNLLTMSPGDPIEPVVTSRSKRSVGSPSRAIGRSRSWRAMPP